MRAALAAGYTRQALAEWATLRCSLIGALIPAAVVAAAAIEHAPSGGGTEGRGAAGMALFGALLAAWGLEDLARQLPALLDECARLSAAARALPPCVAPAAGEEEWEDDFSSGAFTPPRRESTPSEAFVTAPSSPAGTRSRSPSGASGASGAAGAAGAARGSSVSCSFGQFFAGPREVLALERLQTRAVFPAGEAAGGCGAGAGGELGEASPVEEEEVGLGVTFRAAEGTWVGVVGAARSGKSCLVDAITGTLQSRGGGTVWLDGEDCAKVPHAEVVSKVAVAEQRPFVFHASLRFNIDPIGEAQGDWEIWAALEQALFASTVKACPGKLDTILRGTAFRWLPGSTPGLRLTPRERALLGLARAMFKVHVRRSRLLILDGTLDALSPADRARLLERDLGRNLAVILTTRHPAPAALAKVDIAVTLTPHAPPEVGDPKTLMSDAGSRLFRLAASSSHSHRWLGVEEDEQAEVFAAAAGGQYLPDVGAIVGVAGGVAEVAGGVAGGVARGGASAAEGVMHGIKSGVKGSVKSPRIPEIRLVYWIAPYHLNIIGVVEWMKLQQRHEARRRRHRRIILLPEQDFFFFSEQEQELRLCRGRRCGD
ncbi:P-loop containing nucleoside triphosphate hydrolase protein [Baffinella frigidus]|nr:P-loop containing nucleoside triphosphate hydrolase protein [Cryptophyta sp. CCMP2293]